MIWLYVLEYIDGWFQGCSSPSLTPCRFYSLTLKPSIYRAQYTTVVSQLLIHWRCRSIVLSHRNTLKTESFYNSYLFFTDGTAGCRHDNLWHPQWRRSWHHNDSRFSFIQTVSKGGVEMSTMRNQNITELVDHSWIFCLWYSPSVLYWTKETLFSIMASTASFSQYMAVIIAMVGVSRPVSTGMSFTIFTTETREEM